MTPGQFQKLSNSAMRTGAMAFLLILLAACGGSENGAPSQQVAPNSTSNQAQVVHVNLPAAPAASLDGVALEDQLIQLYQRANPSVVYIIAERVGSGSGFVYDDQGHIVTNNHVVEGARSLEVVFATGDRLPASVVGVDLDGDLAVIKVDGLPSGVSPLPLAAPDNIAVGQFVVAIGNPFGEQGSMSLGIVSGLGRSLTSQRATTGSSSYTLPAVIQTDAPINPGNSGGPLLNLAGEVVGINAAIESGTGANSGVGFSIPVAAVRQIIPALIEKGAYAYPYMGAGFDEEVSLAEQAVYEVPQTQGAYVVSVNRGGPAEQAGLIPADPSSGKGGDLIISVDGHPVRTFQDLNRYLVFGSTVGKTIQLSVLRNGQQTVVPLTLGERP